jgi:hypothetical protein
MDASHLLCAEIVHSGPKHKFSSFYMRKVSKVLRNTPKHHFGSDGVEWMLHNFGASKLCIQTWNTSLASFTCRRLAKCSVTLPNIILGPMEYNGCFATLVPRKSAFRPETQVSNLLDGEGWRSAPKHSRTLFWVWWSRTDASQLWCPKIVHLGLQHKFSSCYVQKVSEVLCNTFKYHFGSNGVKWMLRNYGSPK